MGDQGVSAINGCTGASFTVIRQSRSNTLDVFLKVKDSYIELEITKQIDSLYHKTVPATVRDFISRKQEMSAKREEE